MSDYYVGLDVHKASICVAVLNAAGKRLSGRTNKGSTYLRNALIQSAWAASHTKETYLAAQYRRLARTKGQKRALVAVGHSILVIAYHILERRAGYEELGGDYFDRQSTEHLRERPCGVQWRRSGRRRISKRWRSPSPSRM